MGDPIPTTSIEEEQRAQRHRAARLALPAVSLSEWCQLHGVKLSTAKGWAQRGVFPHGAAWQSGRDWLIRPGEPVPRDA